MSTKTIEVSGKTEDEAIKKALVELGMSRDEVSVEIIARAKTGFLGLGASPAVVRVSYSQEASQAEKAETFLLELLKKMNTDAAPLVSEEDGIIKVELKGENMGRLIGRRGETLDAIQHLTGYAVNRGAEKRVRVNVDAENYRKKREEALIRLAEKVAAKVVKYRKNLSLEPMNSYERHVIHTALQDCDGVTTYSTGTEPSRRIIVAYNRTKSAAGNAVSREWA